MCTHQKILPRDDQSRPVHHGHEPVLRDAEHDKARRKAFAATIRDDRNDAVLDAAGHQLAE
jgi:hypothetical protein